MSLLEQTNRSDPRHPGEVPFETVFLSITAADVGAADRHEVARTLRDVTTLRNWLDSVEVDHVLRLEELAQSCPSIFPEQIVAEATGRTLQQSVRVHRRAAAAASMPAVGSALRAAAIGGAHLDVLADALRHMDTALRPQLILRSDRLATIAAATLVPEFRRAVANEVRSIEADDGRDRLQRQRAQTGLDCKVGRDGMVHLSGRLDPANGLPFLQALADRTDQLFRGEPIEGCPEDPMLKQRFLRAHALMSLVLGGGAQAGRPQFIVTIDQETLATGERRAGSRVDTGFEGLDLPIEHLLGHLGDADVVPVVLDDDGVAVKVGARRRHCDRARIAGLHDEVATEPGLPLDAGRSSRLATRQQRWAIRAMYRWCAFPGCCVPVRMAEPHHTVEWEQQGHTDLGLLAPLCRHHHDRVHAKGWRLSLSSRRCLSVTYPDGSVMTTGPPRDQWR